MPRPSKDFYEIWIHSEFERLLKDSGWLSAAFTKSTAPAVMLRPFLMKANRLYSLEREYKKYCVYDQKFIP
jgi:hypothetical protein